MTPLEVPEAARAFPADSRAVELWARLHRDAAYWAARYNGPVYLVGSCLKSGMPRDVDIRVEVADAEFCARYHAKHYTDFPNQRWVDDMAKRSGELARDFRINPDFQVYPASHCIHYRNNPRLLLAAPSNLDHIAASTAWWDGPADSSLAPITDATGYTGEEGG